MTTAKQYLPCNVLCVTSITKAIFRLDCSWTGSAPRAGQFFMLKPDRSGVFLPRPVSAAFWGDDPKELTQRHKGTKNTKDIGNTVVSGSDVFDWISFLILRRGKGTEELAALSPGETIYLSGPLGNSWEDFLPETINGKTKPDTEKPAALIGGGIGIAPLLSLPAKYPSCFDFYAGFRASFDTANEQENLLGTVTPHIRKLVLTFEQQSSGVPLQDANGKITICQGRIPDFLNPADYSVVFACGPEVMLHVVAEKCAAAGVFCYASLERRMACGVGACLGCTVQTASGNRRCCADGPVFAM